MSLRLQLLIVALVILLLPLAGWQSVREMESFLRQGREEALMASTRVTAGALREAFGRAAESEGGLYVRHIGYPPTMDGYADDWSLWLPWSQTFGRGDELSAELALARDERFLYGLLRVEDPEIRYLNPRVGREGADFVRLAMNGSSGRIVFDIATAAPGRLEASPVEGDDAVRLRGAWQETGEGYALEWRLPRRGVESMGFAVFDADRTGSQTVLAATGGDGVARPLPLVAESGSLSDRLEGVLPPGTRGWMLDNHRWVRARAGRLAGGAPGDDGGGRWWRSLVYRYVLAPPLDAPRSRPAIAPRLDGPEITRSLAGAAAVRWQAAPQENTVLASVAVPVEGSDGEQAGVLVVEEMADALLVFTNSAVLRMVGLTLLAFAAAVVALLAFASVLSLRIRRLRDAAENSLTPDGRVRAGFPVPRARDELGDLGRSFGTLLSELRGHTEYLRTLADKLSHELRTPLTMVRSSLDNLEQETLPASASRYAHRAREGADRLAAILRAMSEATRMEESIRHAETEMFDPAGLVQEQVSAWRDLHSGLRFEADTPPEGFRVAGAPELVSRLLDKLLENAVDFTPAGGLIRIRVARTRQGWSLGVFNQGPPLPDGAAGRLFKSMVSGRRDRKDGVHLGLGLYIARLVAEFHRGTITARNTGDGVEFEVSFVDLKR